MRKAAIVCALLAVAAPAWATTAMIESFNGSYEGGPVGPKPAGWTYFGYGPPAYTTQETGIVEAPNDGTNSSWRIDVPGSATNGTIAIYKLSVNFNSYALPGQPIDWNQPVYVKVDVFGNDLSSECMFKTTLDVPQTTGRGLAEWGDNGVGNAHWETLTTQLSAQTGNVILFLDFDFNLDHFQGNSTAIWENLRLEYAPEPSSLLMLGGLAGLGFRRRSR